MSTSSLDIFTITSTYKKEWRLKGKLHREDGPSVEYANGDNEWYLNGKRISEEEHSSRTTLFNCDNSYQHKGLFPVNAWMFNLEPFGWKKEGLFLKKMNWVIHRAQTHSNFLGEQRGQFGSLIATEGSITIPFVEFKQAFPEFVHGDCENSPKWV
jgi:hypothetical protein